MRFVGNSSRIIAALKECLLLALVLNSVHPALSEQPPAVSSVGTPQSSSDPQAEKSSAPEIAAEADSEEIGPLEPWVPIEPQPAASSSPQNSQDQENEVLPSPLPEEAESEKLLIPQFVQPKKIPGSDFAPVEVKSVLNPDKRKRLKNANRIRQRVIHQQNRWLRSFRPKDYRGESEIRICSLNLEGLSSFEKKKGVSKGANKAAAKGKEIVELITQQRCGLAALQGISAPDLIRARETLDQLIKRLSNKSKKEWTGYLGETGTKNSFTAVVISGHDIRVETIGSYAHFSLSRMGNFRESLFLHPPMEMTLRIKGRADSRFREVVLFNIDLGKVSAASELKDEWYRMQMAENIRRIIRQRKRQHIDDADAIYVILGERGGTRNSPTTQVLEGRLHLKDFDSGGSCQVLKLEQELPMAEKHKESGSSKKTKPKAVAKKVEFRAECKEGTGHPKALFGVLGENVAPVKIRSRQIKSEKHFFVVKESAKAARKKQKDNWDRTSEIYLLPASLNTAALSAHSVARYSSSSAALPSGGGNNSLIAVDLNW